MLSAHMRAALRRISDLVLLQGVGVCSLICGLAALWRLWSALPVVPTVRRVVWRFLFGECPGNPTPGRRRALRDVIFGFLPGAKRAVRCLDLVSSPVSQRHEEMEEGRADSETSRGSTKASSNGGAEELRGFLDKLKNIR